MGWNLLVQVVRFVRCYPLYTSTTRIRGIKDVPSVGGSINIVTNTTNAEVGGSVSYGVGNDSYNKVLFASLPVC